MRLTTQDWISALVHGDQAKIDTIEATTGTKVTGELLENIVADAVAKNLKGNAFLAYVMKRAGKWSGYGVEALGILVAPEFVDVLFRLLERAGFNRNALRAARPFVINVAEGYVRGKVKASDPDNVQDAAIVAIGQTTEVQTSRAFRDTAGYVHLTQVDPAGAPLPPVDGYPQACVLWQQTLLGWNASHPGTTRQQGGGQRGQQPQNVPVPGTRMPIALGEYGALLASGGIECPHCAKLQAVATVAAPKSETFYEKVDKHPACKDVLAAARWFAANNPRSKIAIDFFEDLGDKVEFVAFRMLCDDLQPQVTVHKTPTGARHHVEMDEAAMKEFLQGLDAIGAELKGGNKADEAAHNVWEQIKHAWEHNRATAVGTALLLLAIPVLYIASAPLFLGVYIAGVYGWWENQAWNIGLTIAGAILAILWLMPWYTMSGIKSFFGGLLHSHADEHGNPGLANTARSIGALFLGIGVTAMLICGVGLVWGFSTFLIRLIVLSVAIAALVGYDRIVARWHDSERIHHLAESLSFNNIRTLAVIATAMAVIGIAPFAYMQYAEANTKFPLAVERRDVDGVGIYYIPTPDGKVFRPEDILGRLAAERIVTEMEVDPSVSGDEQSRLPVCLIEGTMIDLPKYSEKEGAACTDVDGNAGVSYTIRPNLWGIGWGDIRTYGSVGELAADQAKADAEEKRMVEAAMPKPPAKPSATPAPGPTVTATPAPQATPTLTNTAPAPVVGVDCSGLSFTERQKRGC